jgi:hypothetical protein
MMNIMMISTLSAGLSGVNDANEDDHVGDEPVKMENGDTRAQ